MEKEWITGVEACGGLTFFEGGGEFGHFLTDGRFPSLPPST